MNKPFINMQLQVNFIKEGASIVAYAPALDLSTSGKTEAQAKKRFEEIARMFFEDLVQKNTLAEVLTDLGWKTNKRHAWQPPRMTNKAVSVKIPALA